jgi:DNA-binding MurR/RpiR family transcriptional regulator
VMIKRKASLPKRLAQIAAFCLANPEDIAFGTAASIASAANVQPSTLVRLAQHFGYEGFSEFQGIFRDRLRERNLSYEERLASLEKNREHVEEAELLKGFIAAAAQSIDKLATSIDPADFAAAVRVIAKAETIFLVARRRAYPLAAQMAYAFGKLHLRYQIVASPNGTDADIVEFATPRDCAIVTSFAPYAPETVKAAETLAARGVPVIAITDSVLSPLAGVARHWFEVAESDFSGFRSISASMALAMALPVAVAEARRQPERGKK